MAKYLLIGSRDPFETREVDNFYELATGLKARGNEVTVFLVQNGVLPARRSAQSGKLEELASAGVKVLADEFSLAERGIAKERLTKSVEPSPLDVVIDHMAQGAKTLWH